MESFHDDGFMTRTQWHVLPLQRVSRWVVVVTSTLSWYVGTEVEKATWWKLMVLSFDIRQKKYKVYVFVPQYFQKYTKISWHIISQPWDNFHLTQFPLLTICWLSTICYYLQFQFNVEDRPTAADCLGLGVGGDPEARSDEIHMVVNSWSLEIFERRLINHNSSSVSLHEDVFLSSLAPVLQVELILEARASSALHRNSEPTLEDGCSVKIVRRIKWKFLSSSLQPHLVPGHFLQSLHSSVREEEAPLTGTFRSELTERESGHRGQSP